MKKILVVCTGNTCRTPMVKALLEKALADQGLAEDVVVDSAGVYAYRGSPASEGSVRAMAARGLDIREHRSKPIDERLVSEADLILVMEEAHRRSIFYTWPQALPKTFLLSEMAGEHGDIPDPIGLSQEAYDQVANYLEDLIRRGLPRIVGFLT